MRTRRLASAASLATLTLVVACHRADPVQVSISPDPQSSGRASMQGPAAGSPSASPAASARARGTVPMPLISRGRPAYASRSSFPPARAFDADYGTQWSSGHQPTVAEPDWIAIDLSSVPEEQRASVYSVWFNEAGYVYDTVEGMSYQLPGDYEIQSHAGPGGKKPPVDGWVTLVSRKGNTLSSGADLLHLNGATWLRFVCTGLAKNTAQMNFVTTLQWDLHDAHQSVDAWKFIGDSITANAMGHKKTNDSFNQLVSQQVSNFPAFEMAGHGYWTSGTALATIDAFLANFPGRFVGLPLGTNDTDPEAYRTAMTGLIDRVLAAGKRPILPTIPYTGEPAHLPLIQKFNAVVHELYTWYGGRLVVGPDLYQVLYDGRATMFDQPNDLHPNEAGNAAIRKAWADAMVARVYRE
jgi:lysophospholipase L1-like esterase